MCTVVEEVSNLEYKETYEKLSELKSNKRSEIEIWYVSQLIRKKYKKKQRNVINHDEKLSENFWSYCKDIFEKDEIIKPRFDKVTCETHFKNIMERIYHHKSFEFPARIKLLEIHPVHLMMKNQHTVKLQTLSIKWNRVVHPVLMIKWASLFWKDAQS